MNVLIAASGTGGHIFPGLYIAKALRKLDPSVQISFVGSGRPLEAKLIEPHGYPRYEIPIVGLKARGIRGMLEFATLLPRAIIKTWQMLSAVNPALVIGVGGYASVLPVVLASLRGIPTWIHEAERKAGLANRLLAHFATRISLAYQDADVPCRSRAVWTGHPVRDDIAAVDKRASVTKLGNSPELLSKRILVLGGSQGAESIDRGMIAHGEWLRSLGAKIVHQCREKNLQLVKEGYKKAGTEVEVLPFINELGSAYEWADIVVARAGAGTLAELALVGTPAILVPLPSKGIQQGTNAALLEQAGKAIVVEEGTDFTTRLQVALQKLFTTAEYRTLLAAPGLNPPKDAADRIAQGCLELISRSVVK